MAQQIRPLEVMVSSRIETTIASGSKLATVRQRIAAALMATPSPVTPLFRVWLSEDEGAGGQDETAWNACMAAAARCDILLVLYNGEAGWLRGGTGICHAEYLAGVARNPAKVRVIRVEGDIWNRTKNAFDRLVASPDSKFFSDLATANAIRGTGRTADEIVEKSVHAIWTAVTDLVVLPNQVVDGQRLIGGCPDSDQCGRRRL